jgi:hypothetical protein
MWGFLSPGQLYPLGCRTQVLSALPAALQPQGSREELMPVYHYCQSKVGHPGVRTESPPGSHPACALLHLHKECEPYFSSSWATGTPQSSGGQGLWPWLLGLLHDNLQLQAQLAHGQGWGWAG